MREYTPDPRVYEMMTILSPDVPEDDLPGQIETIAGYITTAGGTVNETLRESPWGRRRLAYSIRHTGRDVRDGYYTVFHFTLDPSGVRDIERDLKLNDQVMRFLITHYTPKPEVAGATPEGGEVDSAVGETPASADATTADAAPSVEAAGTTDGSNEATEARSADAAAAASMEAEAASSEEAPSTESLTDIAVPAETSDTEAAAPSSEPADAETPASANEAPAAEEAPAAIETPAADETPATEEAPAEPTAPAKDDEEA